MTFKECGTGRAQKKPILVIVYVGENFKEAKIHQILIEGEDEVRGGIRGRLVKKEDFLISLGLDLEKVEMRTSGLDVEEKIFFVKPSHVIGQAFHQVSIMIK